MQTPPAPDSPALTRFDLRRLDAKSDATSLWLLGLKMQGEVAPAYWDDLSVEEKSRADRFLRARDRIAFGATRAALRSLLAEAIGCAPKNVSLATGPYGKPQLAGGSGPQFNVSHSGSFALIGISDQPIGVDIEAMRNDLDALELAKSFFSESEHSLLSGLKKEEQLQSFYKIWTCKEAVLKALGVGISEYLNEFSVELTPCGFRLRPETQRAAPKFSAVRAEPIKAPQGYAAAIAFA